MSKKFKQILTGKHRNHTLCDMSHSNGYIVVHEICTDKTLPPDLKMELISRFCHNAATVYEIGEYFIDSGLLDE